MYDLIIDETSSKARLIFSGALKIQEILSIKEALANALAQTNHLSINHEQANSFDLTYLQALISANKTAEAQNKFFQVEVQRSIDFYALIKDTGCPHYKWLNIDEDEIGTGEKNG